jgi:hypothetical protein
VEDLPVDPREVGETLTGFDCILHVSTAPFSIFFLIDKQTRLLSFLSTLSLLLADTPFNLHLLPILSLPALPHTPHNHALTQN